MSLISSVIGKMGEITEHVIKIICPTEKVSPKEAAKCWKDVDEIKTTYHLKSEYVVSFDLKINRQRLVVNCVKLNPFKSDEVEFFCSIHEEGYNYSGPYPLPNIESLIHLIFIDPPEKESYVIGYYDSRIAGGKLAYNRHTTNTFHPDSLSNYDSDVISDESFDISDVILDDRFNDAGSPQPFDDLGPLPIEDKESTLDMSIEMCLTSEEL